MTDVLGALHALNICHGVLYAISAYLLRTT